MASKTKSYDIILSIINDYLEKKNISTTQIAQDMKVNRQTMVDFRNADEINSQLLYQIFDYLFPGRSIQDLAFIKKLASNCNLRELKNLYQNRETIQENMPQLPPYLMDSFSTDLLRAIVVKEGVASIALAGAEGLAGGAAFTAGGLLTKHLADKMAKKNKRQQISELEDEKRQLRAQMKQKEEDPEGRESIKKRIAAINARIDQIKGLLG